MTSDMTSMYNSEATASAPAERKKVDPGMNIEIHEMPKYAKEKEDYLQPIANPAALGFSTFPVSPV